MADDASRKVLVASIKDCLTSPECSDLRIICGGWSISAHRVIVCSRARFFAQAIKYERVDTCKGTIDLSEDDLATVKLLAQYLYEAEYDPPLLSIPTSVKVIKHGFSMIKINTKQPDEDRVYGFEFPHTCNSSASGPCATNMICPHHRCMTDCFLRCCNFTCRRCRVLPRAAEQLVTHAKMYEMADKYDVVGLKGLAKAKFEAACHVFWDEDSFGPAAHHAFSSTTDEDRGIRDVVSATIFRHMELLDRHDIKALLARFNGLALGILEQKTKEPGFGAKKQDYGW